MKWNLRILFVFPFSLSGKQIKRDSSQTKYFKYLKVIILLLFGINFSNAQKDSLKLFRIQSLTVAFGFDYHQRNSTSQNDFIKLAPQNALVNSDVIAYTNLAPQKLASPSNSYFIAALGFKRLNKKANSYYTNRENRIGLRFYMSTPLLSVYENNLITHYDTLKGNGSTYYNVNVNNTKHYSYFFKRSNLVIDLGTLFNTSNSYLLTGYAGYNIGFGVSITSQVYARSGVDSIMNNQSYNEISSNTEITKITNSFIGSLSIPFGMNLRLAKTKNIWRKCMINLEFRPGINTQSIQHYGIYTTLFFGGHTGFKFLF